MLTVYGSISRFAFGIEMMNEGSRFKDQGFGFVSRQEGSTCIFFMHTPWNRSNMWYRLPASSMLEWKCNIYASRTLGETHYPCNKNLPSIYYLLYSKLCSWTRRLPWPRN